jgi:hypothetical protein
MPSLFYSHFLCSPNNNFLEVICCKENEFIGHFWSGLLYKPANECCYLFKADVVGEKSFIFDCAWSLNIFWNVDNDMGAKFCVAG